MCQTALKDQEVLKDQKIANLEEQLQKEGIKTSTPLASVLTVTNLGKFKIFGANKITENDISTAIINKNPNLDATKIIITNIITNQALIFSDCSLYNGKVTVNFELIIQDFEIIPSIKNGIYAITTDNDDNIYTGGRDNKLFKSLANKKEFTDIATVDSNIYALKQDLNQNIWIGTYKGSPYKYIIKTNNINQITTLKGAITSITCDSVGNIYVGTWETGNYDTIGEGSVYKSFNNEDNFIKMLGTEGQIWSLTSGKDNVIYAGSTKGIYKSKDFTIFNKEPILIPFQAPTSNSVRSLLFDKNGNLYAGTREGKPKVMFITVPMAKITLLKYQEQLVKYLL